MRDVSLLCFCTRERFNDVSIIVIASINDYAKNCNGFGDKKKFVIVGIGEN